MSLASPQNSRQRGAALILALVVTVAVVLVATTLSSDHLVAFRRVENQVYSQQAYAFLRGSEGIARQVLQKDFELSKEKDHISEKWLQQQQDFLTEYGPWSGVICDLQGRFNLNNLSSGSASKASSLSGEVKKTPDQQLFVRLLQTLDLKNRLDQTAAEDLLYAVVDWLDADGNISATGGAEDSYYSDLTPPYRAANRQLTSVEELRWIKGMTPEIVTQLTPLVTVLERGSKLNINTAPAKVLQAINDKDSLQPITEADVEKLINERDGDAGNAGIANFGFDDVAAFVKAHPASEAKLDTSLFGVNSENFLLKTEMIFLERKFSLYSVLYRDSAGLITTTARASTGLGNCKAVKSREG